MTLSNSISYSHLHVHTEYSLLNGALRVEEAVKKAKEYGMLGLALTDLGNIFGAVEFFQAAKTHHIKPVLGCELYLPSHDNHKLKELKRGQHFLWRVVLLVKNKEGYKNLCRLLTKAYLDGFYYKPRIDTALLSEHKEGLIALSSGFTGEAHYHLFQNDPQKAKLALEKFQTLFGENFYLELQDNDLPLQSELNVKAIELADKVGVPTVATNNVYYLNRDDADAFEILRSVQLSRNYESEWDAYQYSTDGYHFATQDEMLQKWKHQPQALSATQSIIDKCDFEFDFKTYHFPKFETPKEITLDSLLAQEARKGFKERFEKIVKLNPSKEIEREQYEERLETELECIFKMGFSGYFLIVSDFIRWAKSQKIPVGPGRGSAAGSLVAYCIEITDLDPIPYNLLFERFLNPERISMPDVDVDFCQDRRSEVIEYVTKKYGHVSQIITFGKMKAKAVLRDVGRVMDMEYESVDKIAKLIPNALNITLKEALEQEERLRTLYETDETIKRLIDTSLKLEGLNRHASVHAAGVVIAEKPLTEYLPLYKGSKEDIVAQFDMKALEKIGLIKFDFLGLKTLTVIQNAIKNILHSKNIVLDITQISLNDTKVYDLLSSGQGVAVFQLESSGMRDLMERLKPSCFEDIIALVALFRPGPLGSGMVDDFIDRKKGSKKIEYDLDELEPILKDTYGVIVYQEQVMQIASQLANYSLGEADLLRRAMGKKKAEEMAQQRERFLAGATAKGISKLKAEPIFDLMAKFAEYGFNKSHSAAYALVSYQTAYLKTYFYSEYMASVLSSEINDTDKLMVFLNDCKINKVKVLPPDINVSFDVFTVEDGHIRYGLSALKGVGSGAIESILTARHEKPFVSFFDFCLRVDLRRVTKKVLDVLIKAGAFDFLKIPRKGLCKAAESIADAALLEQKNTAKGQADLFSEMNVTLAIPMGVQIDIADDWTQSEQLTFEKEAFGFYFSAHPLESFVESLTKLTSHNSLTLKSLPHESLVTLGGVFTQHRVIRTKKGEMMAFATLQDLYGSLEVVVFPKIYQECRDYLSASEPFILKGTIDQSEEGAKIILEGISKLTETLVNTTRSVHLHLPFGELTESKSRELLNLIQKYQGKSVVYLHLQNSDQFESLVELGPSFSVTACEPLQFHVDRLFDKKVVRFES